MSILSQSTQDIHMQTKTDFDIVLNISDGIIQTLNNDHTKEF